VKIIKEKKQVPEAKRITEKTFMPKEKKKNICNKQ